MDFKVFVIDQLKSNVGFISRTLADFTDADMFVRPCPGANHAAWQLGHMISSEASVLKNVAPAHAIALPDGFLDRYKMDANKHDSPADFAPVNTKAQLMELFDKVRGATVATAESMSAEELDGPSPEKYKAWAPTLGGLFCGQVIHSLMHLGQFQVIRRKLGKPVLF